MFKIVHRTIATAPVRSISTLRAIWAQNIKNTTIKTQTSWYHTETRKNAGNTSKNDGNTSKKDVKNDTNDVINDVKTDIENVKNDTNTTQSKDTLVKLPLGPTFIISIPITTNKSYIYCNHKPAILTTAQAQKFPALVKIESKLVNGATKIWTKLSTSKTSVNIKITNLVKSLLNTIPYEENCLKLFPSKQAMIREMQADDPGEKSLVLQSEIDNLRIAREKVLRIPFYHAGFQKPLDILTQLNEYRERGYAHHRKYAIACGVGVPLSLPFALVPVLPNVPGFYLAYRLYCNIKALMGIKHLDYLLGDGSSGTSHIRFEKLPSIDANFSPNSSRQVLITKETIDKICADLHLEHLKEDLIKAMNQETARLEQRGK